MDEIDWIRLWLLNRTVYMRCGTHLLTYDVEREPHWGYWSFPGKPAIEAGVEARIDALRKCVEQGLIEIYHDSWLEDSWFRGNGPLKVDQCHFENEHFLKCTESVATNKGHKLWEEEFQPDWQRYWILDGKNEDKKGDGVIFWITYASNKIFEELLKWLPAYEELNEEYGLKEEGCHTYFGWQTTKWKVLPYVKVLTLRGSTKQEPVFSKIMEEAKQCTSEERKEELKKEFSTQFKLVGERQEKAEKILNRLSGKWDCVWEPDTQSHNSMPVLRDAESGK